ncbi:hypothetical protein ATM97_30050 [Nocardia sp. MH4]|nr:hypothetical protein [Nocardia sp. MH4]
MAHGSSRGLPVDVRCLVGNIFRYPAIKLFLNTGNEFGVGAEILNHLYLIVDDQVERFQHFL